MGFDNKDKEEQKEKILDQARQMFMRYGIRSVTMDDLAKELGISKKTIYQFFKDKNELVNLFTARICSDDQKVITEFETKAKNAIEFVLKVSDYFNGIYANSNPAVIYDLEKYYPEAHQIHEDFDNKTMSEVMQRNIEWGIKDGLYREDIDPEFVSILWKQMLEWASDVRVFPPEKHNLWQTHIKMVDFMMRGMVTLKGFQLMEDYQKQSIKE